MSPEGNIAISIATLRRVVVAGLAAAVVLVLLVLAWPQRESLGVLFRQGFDWEIDPGAYQAVFLTGGQLYFGRLSARGDGHFALSDVYSVENGREGRARARESKWSRGLRQGLEGDLVAEALELADEAGGVRGAIAQHEVVGPEVGVGGAAAEQVVGDDEDRVAHRDDRLLVAAAAFEPGVLRANGATNAQKLIGNFFLGVQGPANTGIGGMGTAHDTANAYSAPVYGTSAIDSAAAPNLVVTLSTLKPTRASASRRRPS